MMILISWVKKICHLTIPDSGGIVAYSNDSSNKQPAYSARRAKVFEKVLLERALHHTRGHKQEAAKRLGWGRNTLTRKLKELNFPS